MDKKAAVKIQVVAVIIVILVATISGAFFVLQTVQGVQQGPLTVTDMTGRAVQLPPVVNRAIIINSYWAEIACALGDSNKIVGIGKDVASSVYMPSAVKNLTMVGDLFGGVNLETVVALKPDVVIMDSGYGISSDLVKSLEGLNISVVTLVPGSYSDDIEAVKIIGQVLGSSQNASNLASNMQIGIQAITLTASTIPASQKPTVVICNLNVWNQGLIYCYSNSTWGDAITQVGGTNLALQNAPGQSWIKVNLETLLAWNPDIIIITGRDNATITSQMNSLNGSWSQLKAVQNGNVFTVLVGSKVQGAYLDDGPRTMLGLMQLAKIVQPAYFSSLDVKSAANQLFAEFYQFYGTS